jgi:hypothetical protein
MATSGTIGQTTCDTTNVIEHAFRRCGKLASTISAELQLSARENLFFLLSDLANRGLSLWCVQKYVLGVNANQNSYPLPIGVVDVNNALYRTKTDLTGSTVSGAGWQGQDLTTAAQVSTVSISFTTSNTVTLVLESSSDNITWKSEVAFPPAQTIGGGLWLCADPDMPATARYWRVRETSGTLPTVSSLVFSTTPYEVPMAKMNGDDYQSLPNKSLTVPTGSKSLQYWFDKQIAPRIVVWPASQGAVDQIVIWTQRHIQDVGALTNTLDIPQRWLESIILTLACRCALELPAGELAPGRYELLSAEAQIHLTQAEAGESDGSSIRLMPNLSCYSR